MSDISATASRPNALNQIPIRPDWLVLREEVALEPHLPIVDAHHHLWDMPGRHYMLDDLLCDLASGHKIEATVYSQGHSMERAHGERALQPVGETEFAAGIAAQSDSGRYGSTRVCAAIMGYLDFSLGSHAEPVLEAHIKAGGGRFRSVRGRCSWDASPKVHLLPTPPEVLMQPVTRDAIRCISDAGLSLEVWVHHPQLQEVADVCQQFPDLPVIINHLGGPIGMGPYESRNAEVFKDWSTNMSLLAEHTSVFVKLGGLGMRPAGYRFHEQVRPPSSDELVAAWKPYIEESINAFGPGRCMFESNFPVDKAMCGYGVLWNAFKKMSAPYSAEQRHDLFAGTATRVYNIPAAPGG